jgi:hypothetical protein
VRWRRRRWPGSKAAWSPAISTAKDGSTRQGKAVCKQGTSTRKPHFGDFLRFLAKAGEYRTDDSTPIDGAVDVVVIARAGHHISEGMAAAMSAIDLEDRHGAGLQRPDQGGDAEVFIVLQSICGLHRAEVEPPAIEHHQHLDVGHDVFLLPTQP